MAMLVPGLATRAANIYLSCLRMGKWPRNDAINAHVSHPLSLDVSQGMPRGAKFSHVIAVGRGTVNAPPSSQPSGAQRAKHSCGPR